MNQRTIPTRRSSEEIKRAFDNQRKALESSCKAFDEGERWEAARIATSVFVFVHDGGKKNKSILTQMNLRSKMQFLCSGFKIDQNNLIHDAPLVIMSATISGATMQPRLDSIPEDHRWVRFGEWWERDHVFSSGSGRHLLTRKKVVFNLRNKEGGSHFDEAIMDPNYSEMVYGRTFQWIGSSGGSHPVREVELATMRQIGWELIQSLDRLSSSDQWVKE